MWLGNLALFISVQKVSEQGRLALEEAIEVRQSLSGWPAWLPLPLGG